MAITKMMKDFVKAECHQGIILFFFAILAIIITNSNFHNLYEQFLSYPFSLNLSFVHIYRYLDVKDWINEGLMAVFFLYVGLELKREIIVGELSSKAKILLPSLAAFAGVVCPALIYSYFNIHDPIHARGWAIPSATDIAFAIGVLSLFGNKIHNSLKIFLVALAVFDDLAAIVIIALFYSNQLNIHYINLIFLMIAILLILNRLKVTSLPIYLICGIVLWIFVLKSGIHSTIAGVLLSIFIPLSSKNKTEAPLQRLEEKLYPVVGYFILPLFAFANSGISFSGLSFDIFSNSIVIGIAAGLFIGKQFGVFTTLFLLDKFKIASLFHHASKLEVYGVAILTGIGFTMSLFIGNLAFQNYANLNNDVVFAVLFGSTLSGIIGFIMIFTAIKLRGAYGK